MITHTGKYIITTIIPILTIITVRTGIIAGVLDFPGLVLTIHGGRCGIHGMVTYGIPGTVRITATVMATVPTGIITATTVTEAAGGRTMM